MATSSTSATAASKVADGFQFLEGPVWIPARQELLFSDIPASKIYRYKDSQFQVFRHPSNQANGNTLDPQGRLITCEHETRRVTRTEADGTVMPVATHFEGKRLNSPNDVVCKSDGSIYFSDPPYAVKAEDRELDFQGVFRVVADSVQLLARDFIKPNGLAFSPDEKILYCADTELGHLRAFDVLPDGSITNCRVFCQVERPDGFRVDVAGNLYIAALKAVEIFDPTGKKLGEITLPERPANIAFGDADRKTLYICARTSLYRARI
ncbi:MAG: SMP-30/gluconolactonase/LRE family protein [Verrucomicrobiota bacterium]